MSLFCSVFPFLFCSQCVEFYSNCFYIIENKHKFCEMCTLSKNAICTVQYSHFSKVYLCHKGVNYF